MKIEISGDGTSMGSKVELVSGDGRILLPAKRFELRSDAPGCLEAEIVIRVATGDPLMEIDVSRYTGPDVCDPGTENRNWDRFHRNR